MSDEERVAWLRESYERIIGAVAEGSGRRVNRVLRYLRESDFYTIPCRHHNFVGGNAWHQLETLAYSRHTEVEGYEDAEGFAEWQPRWAEGDPMGVVVVSLLHDVCNAGHDEKTRVDYPQRIRPRHGRKSTYLLKDHLRFELMFDENMAIIHHQHKDEERLRLETPTEEDFERIWEMPLYRMVLHCDTLSIEHPMDEETLIKEIDCIYEKQ